MWRKITNLCLSPWLVVWQGPRRGNCVALTFDDGPDPTFTQRVLDLFKKTGTKATFFLVGEKVEVHPDLVRRIVQEGHEVGSHSFRHESLRGRSLRWTGEQLRKAEACLEPFRDGTHRLRLFRPPYGTLSCGLLLWAAILRMQIVLWSKDPEDYRCESPEEILRYFQAKPLRSGDIVLLHDKTQVTVEALEVLLSDVQERGLEVVKVSDLLAR